MNLSRAIGLLTQLVVFLVLVALVVWVVGAIT